MWKIVREKEGVLLSMYWHALPKEYIVEYVPNEWVKGPNGTELFYFGSRLMAESYFAFTTSEQLWECEVRGCRYIHYVCKVARSEMMKNPPLYLSMFKGYWSRFQDALSLNEPINDWLYEAYHTSRPPTGTFLAQEIMLTKRLL